METLAAEQFTVSQAARALNLSVSRVKQLTDSRQIPCQRTPLGRLISRAALENFAASRNTRLEATVDTPNSASVDAMSEGDLAAYARARIPADIDELVSLGRRLGLFTEGMRLRPAVDPELGRVCLVDEETSIGYALAAPETMITLDDDGHAL
jgi:excisionase family DNA binding protein